MRLMSPDLSRRTVLQLAIASTLIGCTSSRKHTPMPIVDCHIHCFAGANDPRFPYHANAPYRPNDIASPEALIADMDGAGINFGIVVHPEPYQDDHRYLEHCLALGHGRLKGTCLFFAEDHKAPERLAELAKRTPLIAVRVHAYAPERMPPFGKPELRQLWKAAADAGLMIQLHFEPRWAPGFAPRLLSIIWDVRYKARRKNTTSWFVGQINPTPL
jgi:predicted TIM-barrel fold metal-dependent hydrolase